MTIKKILGEDGNEKKSDNIWVGYIAKEWTEN